ncbi:DUF421 domain-containing protein [Gillisia sp. M10.2A]|uniref:DUF421 domain-containing protein n=1 Tax=Gillisia lutea TaxID=2909668 RepID=A0ABS9EDW0_9FLAO|nr:YetF domain-containing protein [Gillisia lutea]MCF4101045.1 DUF421 domain-containing protein [Gillisia lutea]
MDNIKPFDWYRIFIGRENDTLFLLEIGFRVTFIYLFAVLVMRFMGKRGNRSLSMFENVLIIALGSAIGDSMFYPKVPLVYACVVILVIVGISRYIQYLQLKARRINTFLDGKPIILIKDGEIKKEGLKASRVRNEELYGMLRIGGIRDLGEVEYAFLERSGGLSIFKFTDNTTIPKLNLISEAISGKPRHF